MKVPFLKNKINSKSKTSICMSNSLVLNLPIEIELNWIILCFFYVYSFFLNIFIFWAMNFHLKKKIIIIKFYLYLYRKIYICEQVMGFAVG